MAGFLSLDDLDVAGKRVLVRADLNVPIVDGVVGDRSRLERTAPTLIELADRGARVVVMSHFARPKGRRRPEMSLAPVAQALSEALSGRSVRFCHDCIGPSAEACIAGLNDGDVALLENLRFHAGEEANDGDFAAALAALGELYVNDAFSCAHRAHASTEALAHLMPSAAGRAMEAELRTLTSALRAPERPLAALVGGAKISSKIDILSHLVEQVDMLIVGGAMANTFLAARGIDVGASLVEHDLADTARNIARQAETAGTEILLPVDVRVAKQLKPGVENWVCSIDAVPRDAMILDIGPDTTAALSAKLDTCRTLVWNGPLGAFEVPPFDRATMDLARHAAGLSKAGRLLSVAGGGDTAAALRQAGAADSFSYVSTAGGAFLEWLEGRTLPGIAALDQA